VSLCGQAIEVNGCAVVESAASPDDLPVDQEQRVGPRRTPYFTSETIRAVSASMLDDLHGMARRRLRLRPPRCALLIIDLQRAFLDPESHAFVPSADAILPGIHALRSAFRREGLPVFCTRHGNCADDAGMMATWWGRRIDAASAGAELAEGLATGCGSVLEKTQYDAFYHTSLEEDLARLGVEQVVIVGVMTHLCCDTTARSAFVRGYEVFLPVDGTATYNEVMHRASLLGLAHGVAEIAPISDLLHTLEAA
jgi:isochorismate hydrolase